MKTMLTAVRALAWAALWLLIPDRLLAQSTSLWMDVANELQTWVFDPIASGAMVFGMWRFLLGESVCKRAQGVVMAVIGGVVAILVN